MALGWGCGATPGASDAGVLPDRSRDSSTAEDAVLDGAAEGGSADGGGAEGGSADGGGAEGGSADGGGAEGGSADGGGADGTGPDGPELQPMTAATAQAVAAYARQLGTVAAGVGPRPMAWSMINAACQDRAMALAYALAAAPSPLSAPPPPMVDSELTVGRIESLAALPRYELAMISVAGPLVAHQTLVGPDGADLAGDPEWYFWPYHHGIVVNVEGALRVLDLSLGDDPVPIDSWTRGFVEAGIDCPLLYEADYQEVWVYWNSAFGNFTPPPRPRWDCGYVLTPIFTWRSDQSPVDLADFIASVPSSMQVQLDAFAYILAANHGGGLTQDQLPYVTSRYAPGTVEEVCQATNMLFCQ